MIEGTARSVRSAYFDGVTSARHDADSAAELLHGAIDPCPRGLPAPPMLRAEGEAAYPYTGRMAIAERFIQPGQREGCVGEVRATVELANLFDELRASYGQIKDAEVRRVPLEMLVDTGCSSLLLPEDIVQRLGLRTVDRVQVLYADERTEELPVAEEVRIRVEGRVATVRPVVARPGTEPLLGQLVLEATDLLVDCSNNSLVPRIPGITRQLLK